MRRESATIPPPISPGSVGGRRLRTADNAINVALLIAAAIVLIEARNWPFRASLFPLAAGSAMLGSTILKLAVKPGNAAADPEGAEVFAGASRADWIKGLGWMTTFFLLLWLLGALVTVPLFALVYLLAASRETPLMAGGYALASWLFVYSLFDRLLHIPLPPGVVLAGLTS